MRNGLLNALFLVVCFNFPGFGKPQNCCPLFSLVNPRKATTVRIFKIGEIEALQGKEAAP
jgi:hypothetical protein